MATGYEIVARVANDVCDRLREKRGTHMSIATRLPARAILVVTFIAATAHIAAADSGDSIGTAAAITTQVTGDLPAQSVTLKTGDGVFQNEKLISDTTGIGQFEFRDGTKVALGPGSTLVLDNFVYASDTSKAKVVINLTQGALRFITGNANHDAYQINTPTATIAVRGTAFDVYTKPDGEMAVAMINGAIEVCPVRGACRVHDVIGKFLTMTSDGIFALRDTWDGTFLKGIPLKAALPFISDQSPLIPALKGSTKVVASYADTTGKAVKKAVNGVGKIRLFNPFKLFQP
jgi:hypothetical protein